ncbi:hypothetical protein, partial [Streptomyces sp. NPDC055055]
MSPARTPSRARLAALTALLALGVIGAAGAAARAAPRPAGAPRAGVGWEVAHPGAAPRGPRVAPR